MTQHGYHHGNLRAVLLERAWNVVDAEGVDALSLRQLARDIGVSHGASSRHFRDKRTLLDALAVEGFDRLNGAVADAAGTAGSFSERLSATGHAYVRFAVAHPSILRVMYAAKHHPDASAALVNASHLSMATLVTLIADAQAADEVRPGSPERDALVAFAAVHGVATLATDDLLNDVPWQDAADAVIEFVWRGLAA